jgi:glycerol kinase
MKSSRYLLALDQGTSSSRSILFDREGNPVAMAQREFRQLFPQPGWVEHDPIEIWTTQLATAREALAQAGVSAADVAAIGIANQRETTVLWDRKTGAPLTQRHRLAGPPHGASLRGTGRARAGGTGTRQHRAGD